MKIRFFTFEKQTYLKFCQVVLPRNERLNLAIEDEIVEKINHMLPNLPILIQLGIHFALALLEIGSLAKYRCRFKNLGQENSHIYIYQWIHSSFPLLRDLSKILNGLVLVHFYDDPRVMQHLGYSINDHIQHVNSLPEIKS